MPQVPFFVMQCIDLTSRGVIEWKQVRRNEYRLLGRGDANVWIKSRDGDGNPPYVLVIKSRGAPGTETVGDTDDLQYNEAFNALYAAVVNSLAAGDQRN